MVICRKYLGNGRLSGGRLRGGKTQDRRVALHAQQQYTQDVRVRESQRERDTQFVYVAFEHGDRFICSVLHVGVAMEAAAVAAATAPP